MINFFHVAGLVEGTGVEEIVELVSGIVDRVLFYPLTDSSIGKEGVLLSLDLLSPVFLSPDFTRPVNLQEAVVVV